MIQKTHNTLSNIQIRSLKQLLIMCLQGQRGSVRYEVNFNIMYRTESMSAFESATLNNISKTGLLISTQQKIEENSRIHVVILENNTIKNALQLMATTVRDASGETRDAYAYGCRIDHLYDLDNN